MPHIHEKIDFTVEVFVVHKNKVLLRKHDKYKIWLSIGGHIELDENPNDAAIREAKEEVGLDIELYSEPNYRHFEYDHFNELIPPEFMNIHKINENHKHVTMSYFAKSITNELVLSKKENTDECKWFSLDELDSQEYDIKPAIRYYAKQALLTLQN